MMQIDCVPDGVRRALVAGARTRTASVACLLTALACALGAAAPAEAQMQTATGSYVGNGLAGGQTITVGFAPAAVFVKGDTTEAGVVRTSTMAGGSKDLNLGGLLAGGLITALTGTGFTVGDVAIDARVNQAGVVYYWTALKAAVGELSVGTYVGNSPGGQTVAVGFQPDWVAVFGDSGGLLGCHRNSAMPGDNTVFVRNSGPLAGRIQALVATGFQLGAGSHANDAGVTFHYIAVKNVPGRFASGIYTGDGFDNRSITGIGLVAKWVIVRHTTIARSSVHRSDTLTNDSSLTFVNTVGTPDQLQLLMSDGFQVGMDTAVNAPGAIHMWMAFGVPSGGSRVKTGSYSGNGTAGNAVFVGFQPDAVIVKRAGADPQVYAVMRTSTMTGDNTKSLDDAPGAVLAPNLIQSLTATGFTVGTDNAVNTNGTAYHWMAFKGGPGEMVAGTYTGNGTASQSITGLGFSPDYVIVLPTVAGTDGIPMNSTSTMPANTAHDFDNLSRSPDTIQGLDPDGFRVGLGGGIRPNLNFNGTLFHYVAWNAVPGKMQVGTYQGDGADNRNLDLAGFFPELVLVKQFPDVTNDPWNFKTASTGVAADFGFRFNAGTLAPPPLVNSVQQLRPLGFQVGNDDRVNASLATCGGVTPCTYHWIAFGPLPPVTNLRSIGDTAAAAHVGTADTRGNGSNVTATNGSPFVSCAGTCNWRTFNRGRGDVILIDAVPYTVAGLSSETALMLATPYAGTTSGGKSYSIQRQFATLQAWEDCISFGSDGGAGSDSCTYFDVASGSLIADHRSEVGIAYNDSAVPAAADFNAGVKINGAAGVTTDATHTIKLTADPGNRHHGIPGAGVLVANGGPVQTIEIQDDYVTVEWLELDNTGAAGGIYVRFISAGSGSVGASQIVIRNNLVHASGGGFGISLDDGNMVADVYNNIVYRTFNAIRVVSATLFTWTRIRVLNNTMYDYLGSGFDSSVTTLPQQLTLTNNIAADADAAGTAFVLAGPINGASRSNLSANSASSDLTAGIGANPPFYASPGGGGLTNRNTAADVDFVNAGAFDLHILTTSAAANSGTDLSSIVFTDIDAGVRQSPWDIGADDAAATTEVTLQSFSATGLDSAVLLEWRTASELRNLGFHVYRSLGENRPWTRLTTTLIPGLGSSAVGQAYSWRDSGLTNGTRYFYRLEDVDASSKTTSHGPVSAVPSAAAVTGSKPKGDTNDGQKRKTLASTCPDWVLAAYGSATGSDPKATSLRCTRHGDPEAVWLGELSRDARQATLELRTGGFYALHAQSGAGEPAGTVRVFVPGFDFPQDDKAAALPIRRVLADAMVGRRVQLGGVRALELQSFALQPSTLGKAEMQVGRDGTVRALRRSEARAEARAAKRFPRAELATLRPSLFQGEKKSAAVEIAPLRYDAQRRQLVLAKRVLVKLLFTGREVGESGRGSVGRAPRRKGEASGEVLARLFTTTRGLYAVGFEQLFPGRARGFAASELNLQRQGEAVAFRVEPSGNAFGPGGRLYFYADRTTSSTEYSGELAYELLHVQGGVLMPLVSAAPGSAAVTTDSVVTRTFETNRFYQPGLLEAPDLWLWEAAASGATRVKSFTLAGVSGSGTAALDVYLQGASESGQTVDHHLSVSLNGTAVGEAQFAGKKPYRVSLSVEASLLREGSNELSLTNVADTGVSSLVFLDRFEVSHPQLSSLAGGVFEGTWSESGTATIAGASGGVVVLELGSASSTPATASTGSPPRWLTGYKVSGEGLRFRAEAGRPYQVRLSSALLSPRVATPQPSTLKSAGNQADYLLIAPQAFLAAAEPLLERRADQGLTARGVAFEEIAAEFGHGQGSAEAIQAFLAHAFQSWSRPSPRYVLLLGDASYDPRNFVGNSLPAPLPALWTRTSYLWTASDPLLAAVNGADSLPDLAIGRLPATTVEQAQALVAKLIAWEDSGQGLAGAAALVADNPDLAGDFEADVEDIRASYLGARDATVLKLSELGAATRPAILDALNGGLSHLNYVGHGGAAVWASENVWNTWDAPSLQAQSQQPLLVTMNCLNGYFVAPAFESLSESLVKAEGRGAIAAFAPSGLSLDGPAHEYHRALMEALTSGRHERLGDAVLAAQKTYAETGLMPELVGVYHLLGDPAMKIR